MLDLLHHLFPPDLGWIYENYQGMIYGILFGIIFIETGLVIMPFLPGDSLLFFAGLTARQGQLSLASIILLLSVAAVLGDNVNYWVGRKIGVKIFHLKIRGRSIVKEKYLEETHLFFEKHGTKAIILARFVPFVRTFAPFAAGVGEMNYRRFFIFDVAGGFLWISLLTAAGFLLGQIGFIQKHIEAVCIGIVIISLLPIVFEYFKKRKQI